MNAIWTRYLPGILREWLEGNPHLRKAVGNTGWLLFDRIIRMLIGVTVGVAIALMVTRLAASLLIGVSATDPLIFVAASLFLLAIAFAANYIPARRATRVDPNDALRCQ